MKNNRILVVGAGFSGAVIARELAESSYQVELMEARDHIAGNCHTVRDDQTGVMVHQYGPHIFHTDDEDTWDYINRYGEFMPYKNQVKSTVNDRVYSLPINLHTINQFFGKALRPDEAKEFIENLADKSIDEPENFEEQALKFVGKDLYESFFKGYTNKQWGRSTKDLPASILKRLPVRFSYDDNYFFHRFQGMPKDGYTKIVKNILDHQLIKIRLRTDFQDAKTDDYDHVFFTGPLDAYFDYCEGRLSYRTLDFERGYEDGDYQGCAVMNFGDENVPFTRISEHKHFAPWEHHDKTVFFKEYPRECEPGDIPYYPVRLVNDKELLKKYVKLANQQTKTTFVGRLATYRYLDMDVTIREARGAAASYIKSVKRGERARVFSVTPI